MEGALNESQERKGWGVGTWIGCGCGGCILVIATVVGLVVALGGLAFVGFRKSDVFEEGMRRARADPQVIEALGEPIEAGLLVSGSFNISGAEGKASLSIPIAGPKGKGKLYLDAEKSAGEWRFDTLEVEIESTGERIDLLGGEIEVRRRTPSSAPRPGWSASPRGSSPSG